MPLYEYECVKCGARTERIEKYSGPHLKKCPKCGGKVERMVAAPAVQFKGSGWYVTDYAGKKATTEAGTAAKAEGKEHNEHGEKKEAPKEAPKTTAKEK